MAERQARAGRVRAVPARLLVAVLAAATAAGCATVPDGGPVTTATIGQKGAGQGLYIQMVVPGPQPGWEPAVIVSGFLLASASFAGDHAVAREYLTPRAAGAWHPTSAAEFTDTPTVTSAVVAGNGFTVRVTGQLLGSISKDGQYQAAEQGANAPGWDFNVVRVGGQWRISNPPDVLLLSRRDVDRTYRAHDLYFYDPSLAFLVPDPVYIPAEASTAQLVTSLVDALRQGPQGWLAAGAKTAFPPRTTLLGTSVAGGTATIDLGGHAAAIGSEQRDEMATQLVQTLVSPPGAALPDVSSIGAVVFEINGAPVRVSCSTGDPPALQLPLCQGPVPRVAGSRAYYIDSRGRVATLGPRSDAPVPGPAGTGEVRFDQIAVSPDELTLAGVAGDVLYVAGLTQNGTMTAPLIAPGVTSLSWDNAGGLWVAADSGGEGRLWRLDLTARPVQPVQVGLPAGFGPVTSLRVAPDGVRVAVITGSGATARLWLAAIERVGSRVTIGTPVPIGTDIGYFVSLTWHDPGDVIVLSQPPLGPALYEVPLDGGQSSQIFTESDTVAVAASGAGPLVAARSDGTLIQLPDPTGSIWGQAGVNQSQVSGQSPVYPG